MVVTNNNGVWTGWLDLLPAPLQSLVTTMTYNTPGLYFYGTEDSYCYLVDHDTV
jgi:hypothetical protein